MYIIKSVQISPVAKVRVEVTTKPHGYHVTQRLPLLFEKRQFALAKGVVLGQHEVCFKFLITNFDKTHQYLVKDQVIASDLPQRSALVSTRIPIHKMLGVTDSDGSEKPARGDVSKVSTPPSENSTDPQRQSRSPIMGL